MKTGYIILVAVVLIILAGGGFVIGRYNMMQRGRVTVEGAWAQVENVYQTRYDLVPNLVATVKGVANFEQETLTQVVEARAKMGGQINIPPEALNDPAAFARFEAAQQGLSSALSRLMVVVERYPELQATQNFRMLQDQLEGIENRIRTERMRYNDSARDFNQRVVTFPNNIFAGMFNVDTFQFFQAAEGAETAPVVDFN